MAGNIKRRTRIEKILFLVMCLFFSLPSISQDLINNPNDLRPKSIFDGLSVEVPNIILDIITDTGMKFTTARLGQRKFMFLSESGNCHQTGCINIILSIDGNRLFDPVLFLSDKQGLIGNDYYVEDDMSGTLCVSGRTAYKCEGVK